MHRLIKSQWSNNMGVPFWLAIFQIIVWRTQQQLLVRFIHSFIVLLTVWPLQDSFHSKCFASVKLLPSHNCHDHFYRKANAKILMYQNYSFKLEWLEKYTVSACVLSNKVYQTKENNIQFSRHDNHKTPLQGFFEQKLRYLP